MRFTRHSAFSLVEVTLALGIAVFCMLAIVGLLPVGILSNQAAINQTTAAGLTGAIIADLRGTPKPPSTKKSSIFQIAIPNSGTAVTTVFLREDGSVSGGVNQPADATQNPRYRAQVTFPLSQTGKQATIVDVLITWPALADQAIASGVTDRPKNYAGSYEAITAIDRN